MKKFTTALAIIGLVLVLGAANYTIASRQAVVDNGREILLPLRPVDPRSLMQGDYMRLRYVDTVFPEPGSSDSVARNGRFVLLLDSDNVASFSRLDDGSQLRSNETLLKYKLRGTSGTMKLGAETFFFQEGYAEHYDRARFAVLHVQDNGRSVLVGLANEEHEQIVIDNDQVADGV